MNFLDSSQAMDYALNRDRMRLKELSSIASILLLVVVPIFALAAPREKAMVPSVRPLAVAAETKADVFFLPFLHSLNNRMIQFTVKIQPDKEEKP